MANDYIPRPDARFHAWQDNLLVCVNGHLADWGPAPADPAPTPPPPRQATTKTQSREEERATVARCPHIL